MAERPQGVLSSGSLHWSEWTRGPMPGDIHEVEASVLICFALFVLFVCVLGWVVFVMPRGASVFRGGSDTLKLKLSKFSGRGILKGSLGVSMGTSELDGTIPSGSRAESVRFGKNEHLGPTHRGNRSSGPFSPTSPRSPRMHRKDEDMVRHLCAEAQRNGLFRPGN